MNKIILLSILFSAHSAFSFWGDELSEARAKICTRAATETGITANDISHLKSPHKFNGEDSRSFAEIYEKLVKPNLTSGSCTFFRNMQLQENVDLTRDTNTIFEPFKKSSVRLDPNCNAQAILICLNNMTSTRLQAVKDSNKSMDTSSGFVSATAPVSHKFPNGHYTPMVSVADSGRKSITKLGDECYSGNKASCDEYYKILGINPRETQQGAPSTGQPKTPGGR